jgi:glycolate oxidase iron-sulfur subunit
MQVARHLKTVAPDIWVAHTIDALWASYGGEAPLGRWPAPTPRIME